jgi:hypothetical protein
MDICVFVSVRAIEGSMMRVQLRGEVVVAQTPRGRTLRGVCVHRAIMCRLNGNVVSTSCQLPAGHNKHEYVTVRHGMLADNGDAAAKAKPTATLRRKKGGKAR